MPLESDQTSAELASAFEQLTDHGALAATTARPRILSGMQPTADSLHLGNYLGALASWVELQDDHEAYYMVADQHTITVEHDPAALRRRSRITAAQFIAAGVDPVRSVVFVQSHVPEHAQLGWVMNCITGFGEASRMTQFKDKATKAGESHVSVGYFAYPMLQAADILLYDADQVPVGEDQRQHLELTRDLAGRFNHRFGDTFVVPEPYIVKERAKIFDLQHPDKKMSKSLPGSGCLDLLDDVKVSVKKIKSAVTDDGREIAFDPEKKPGVSNLLTIASVLGGSSVDQLVQQFEGSGYGDLKGEVARLYTDFVEPFAEKTRSLLENPQMLDAVLADGAYRARQQARRRLQAAYDAVGFVPGPLGS